MLVFLFILFHCVLPLSLRINTITHTHWLSTYVPLLPTAMWSPNSAISSTSISKVTLSATVLLPKECFPLVGFLSIPLSLFLVTSPLLFFWPRAVLKDYKNLLSVTSSWFKMFLWLLGSILKPSDLLSLVSKARPPGRLHPLLYRPQPHKSISVPWTCIHTPPEPEARAPPPLLSADNLTSAGSRDAGCPLPHMASFNSYYSLAPSLCL